MLKCGIAYSGSRLVVLGAMSRILLSFFILFVFTDVVSAKVRAVPQAQDIYAVAYGGGQNFYHFPIRLTPENTRLTLPGYKSRYSKEGWVYKDGLFEFYVKKEAIPVKTPRCQRYAVVRSPYIPCDNANANQCQKQRIQREALFHEIEYTLKNGGGINVVLETVPGFTNVSGGTAVLNSCNLYLRTYKNDYIGYTGPLKQATP